jgi:hypothetical protein
VYFKVKTSGKTGGFGEVVGPVLSAITNTPQANNHNNRPVIAASFRFLRQMNSSYSKDVNDSAGREPPELQRLVKCRLCPATFRHSHAELIDLIFEGVWYFLRIEMAGVHVSTVILCAIPWPHALITIKMTLLDSKCSDDV